MGGASSSHKGSIHSTEDHDYVMGGASSSHESSIHSTEDHVALLDRLPYASPRFIRTCEAIKKDIQKLNGVVSVHPSYTSSGKLIFLIFKRKKEIPLPLHYRKLKVELRNIENPNYENDVIITSKLYKTTDLKSRDETEMNKLLVDNYQSLFESHSNLLSITASSIKSECFGERDAKLIETPCFVLFVPAKGYIPITESEFPKHIGIYPTDVREGIFTLYGPGAQQYHSTLPMGCAISGERKDTGTLGVFVDQNNKIGFITSAHVLISGDAYTHLKERGTIGRFFPPRYVYQPTSDSNNDIPIGEIANAVYRTGDSNFAGVEAVLVELTDTNRYPRVGKFPDGDFTGTGFTPTSPMMFNSGNVVQSSISSLNRTEVLKFGSESGITRGLFKLSGPCVHRAKFNDGNEVVLLNQLQILGTSETQFAKPGDSGAMVFVPHEGNDQDLRALGIITGGLGHTICCVTPIWDVLNALDPSLKLKIFSPIRQHHRLPSNNRSAR